MTNQVKAEITHKDLVDAVNKLIYEMNSPLLREQSETPLKLLHNNNLVNGMESVVIQAFTQGRMSEFSVELEMFKRAFVILSDKGYMPELM